MKPSLTGSPNCLDQYNSSVLGSKRKEAQNVLPLLCSSFIWPSVGLCLLLLSAAITSIPQKEIKLTGRTKLSFIACWEACFLIQSLVCSEYPPPPHFVIFLLFCCQSKQCMCLFIFSFCYKVWNTIFFYSFKSFIFLLHSTKFISTLQPSLLLCFVHFFAWMMATPSALNLH